MSFIDRRAEYEKLNRQLEEQARLAFLEKAQLVTERQEREASERGKNSFQFTQANELQAFKDGQFNERWKLEKAREGAEAAREAKYNTFLENQKRENAAFSQKPMLSKLMEGNAFANKQAASHSEFLKNAEADRKAFETKLEIDKKALSEKQAYEKKAFENKQLTEKTDRAKMIAEQKAASETLAKHQTSQNQLAAVTAKQQEVKGQEPNAKQTPEDIQYSTGMGKGKNWNQAWANTANQSRNQARDHAARQAELTAQQDAAHKAGHTEQAKMVDLQKQLDAKQYERGLAISVANKEHLIRGNSEDYQKYTADAELARREALQLEKAIEVQQKAVDEEKAVEQDDLMSPMIVDTEKYEAAKQRERDDFAAATEARKNEFTKLGGLNSKEAQDYAKQSADIQQKAEEAIKRLDSKLTLQRIDSVGYIEDSARITKQMSDDRQKLFDQKTAPPSLEDSPENAKPTGAVPVAPGAESKGKEQAKPPSQPSQQPAYSKLAAKAEAMKKPDPQAPKPETAPSPPSADTKNQGEHSKFAAKAEALKKPGQQATKTEAPDQKIDKPKDHGHAPRVDKPVIAPRESNNMTSSANWKSQCEDMNKLRGAMASNNVDMQKELQTKMAEQAKSEKDNSKLAAERGDVEKSKTHDAQSRACEAASKGDMTKAQAAENEGRNGRLNGRLHAANNPKGHGPENKEPEKHNHDLKPESAKPKAPENDGPTPTPGGRKPEPEHDPEPPKKAPPPPPPPPPEPDGPCM